MKTEAILALAKAASRLAELVSSENQYQGLGAARYEYNKRIQAGHGLKFRAENGGYSRDPTALEIEYAKRATAALQEQFEAEGREARFNALIRVSDEIERLKYEIGPLAQRAFIEAAQAAKAINHEAFENASL